MWCLCRDDELDLEDGEIAVKGNGIVCIESESVVFMFVEMGWIWKMVMFEGKK